MGLFVGCQMKEQKSYIGPSEASFASLTPEALLSLGRISSPVLSPDGKTIVFAVSYISIEENRSVSNFWVTGVEGGEAYPLTKEGSSVSNPVFVEGGKALLFLQNGKIYKAPFKGCGAAATLGQKRLICEGIRAASCAESCPNCCEGQAGGAVEPSPISEFQLSPDGSAILLMGEVKGPTDRPVDKYADLDKADAYLTDDLMYRHWDHWTVNIPHTFVAGFADGKVGEAVDILGEEGKAFELPTEPFGGLEQLSWSPDGKRIAYSVRRKTGMAYAYSTNTDIYIYERESGETIPVYEAGGYDSDPVWSPDGQYLAWVSMERDGYEADRQRILIKEVGSYFSKAANIAGAASGIDASSGATAKAKSLLDIPARELTKGFDADASGLAWSEDSREIRFTSQVGGLQGVFSVDLEGHICALTRPDDWHDYFTPFAVGEGKALLTRYSLLRPLEICELNLSDGSVRDLTNINGRILDAMTEPEVEERWIDTVDGKKMLTWVIYPPHFDASKTYPSILITLGGPQGSISQDWSYRWCYRLMAEQGYVVVLPNRRGTTAFGQEWKEQISGDYIGLNMQDYLAAARALKKEPFVGKMAACGASYGGYSVYYLSGIHKDVFDCFIAHAGIFNEEQMYYTTEELWFPEWDNTGGYPSKDVVGEKASAAAAASYKTDGPGIGSVWSKHPKAVRHYANSPHKLVQNWHTPLLVMHGGRDYRIPYEQGMAAFNAAKMLGVPARMVIFPEENHWILSPQNALLWHREYFAWLDRWCK